MIGRSHPIPHSALRRSGFFAARHRRWLAAAVPPGGRSSIIVCSIGPEKDEYQEASVATSEQRKSEKGQSAPRGVAAWKRRGCAASVDNVMVRVCS